MTFNLLDGGCKDVELQVKGMELQEPEGQKD